MRCEICGGESRFDFSKTFDAFGLGRVDYWRCVDCGFVLSRTHAEMTSDEWTAMNAACHGAYQGQAENPLDPKWRTRLAAQARAIAALAAGGLLDPAERWLDFGCGDGVLSDLLAAEHDLNLLKYDEYMAAAHGGAGYLPDAALAPEAFNFVLTTSVFEHLVRRAEWDRIEALVKRPGGAFGLHTLVAERVPSNPDWFYLEPPHAAFFSNEAMRRLFEAWGYRCSIYSVAASLWLFFRDEPSVVEAGVERVNALGLAEPFAFQTGFLDYWKVDPLKKL